MKISFTAEISRREDVTGDLFKLWLNLGENREKFSFKAGQYCTIGLLNDPGDGESEFVLDRNGKKALRPYSIVSAPYEEQIELFVELVPDTEDKPADERGNLTPLLHRMKVGDKLEVLPKPKGVFTFEPKYKNQVMVATVTGIAPFVSMIREYTKSINSGHNFYVLHGASYMDEFGYYDELFKFEGSCFYQNTTFLIYIPTISRPDEAKNLGWPHREIGRVNTLVKDFFENAPLKRDNTLVYACGHPGMVEDVKERLDANKPGGWTVKEERFWKEET